MDCNQRRTGGTGRNRRTTATVTAAAAVAALALTLTACGSSSDSSSAGSASEAAPQRPGTVSKSADGASQVDTGAALSATTIPASADAVAAPTGSALGSGSSEQAPVPALQPVDLGRSIIFTAQVAVQVDSVAEATERAMTAMAGVGGFLYGQQSTTDPIPSSTLTFKVAPASFQDALQRLGGVGDVLTQDVSTDDVTGSVVDLESRITAAQVSVERMRGFLAQATDVATLTELERQLLDRESQLETLQGQLRSIQSQVDLATITLTLTQPAPDGPAYELVVTAYAGADDGVTSCPGEDDLSLAEGEAMTVCYTLTNTGDNTLTNLRIDDPGLGLKKGAFALVQGDLSAPLNPDGVIVVAATVDADPSAFPSPRVRATAVDANGDPIRVEVQADVQRATLDVAADTSRPGFGDGLRRGWHGLLVGLGALVLVLGFLLPFVWVLPLAYGARVLWRRRQARRPQPAPRPLDMPAPPAMPAPATGAAPDPVLVGMAAAPGPQAPGPQAPAPQAPGPQAPGSPVAPQ